LNIAAVEIKAFVPAADFALSKEFYVALGFEIPWSSEDLAYVRHGGTSFLLQAFNEPEFIKNDHLLGRKVPRKRRCCVMSCRCQPLKIQLNWQACAWEQLGRLSWAEGV
jgi:hypothetical protein